MTLSVSFLLRIVDAKQPHCVDIKISPSLYLQKKVIGNLENFGKNFLGHKDVLKLFLFMLALQDSEIRYFYKITVSNAQRVLSLVFLKSPIIADVICDS